MKLTVKLAGAMLAVTAAIVSVPAVAAPTYTGLYIFGDSLSDTGNVADYAGVNLPTPPFYMNSFTNGPVAMQVFAQRLGFNANPSRYLTGGPDPGQTFGNNYSVAGATAALTGAPLTPGNLPVQITAYTSSVAAADPNALYTVFIGGNDVRRAADSGLGSLVTDGVTAELASISRLYTAGARNFLIVNVPDISTIPEYLAKTPQQQANAFQFTNDYNSQLAAGVTGFSNTLAGARFLSFDLYTYGKQLLANPAQIGITNTTQACYTSYPGPAGPTDPFVINPACGPYNPTTRQAANIDQFFYWDKIHPTATVHAALGNRLFDFVALDGAVPEPATWAMMIAGFGAAGIAMRRRRRVTVRYA